MPAVPQPGKPLRPSYSASIEATAEAEYGLPLGVGRCGQTRQNYFAVSCNGLAGDCVDSLGMEAHPVTQPAQNQRKQPAEDGRCYIAKRVFEALCAKFPEKYIALVHPPDPVPAVAIADASAD